MNGCQTTLHSLRDNCANHFLPRYTTTSSEGLNRVYLNPYDSQTSVLLPVVQHFRYLKPCDTRKFDVTDGILATQFRLKLILMFLLAKTISFVLNLLSLHDDGCGK